MKLYIVGNVGMVEVETYLKFFFQGLPSPYVGGKCWQQLFLQQQTPMLPHPEAHTGTTTSHEFPIVLWQVLMRCDFRLICCHDAKVSNKIDLFC